MCDECNSSGLSTYKTLIDDALAHGWRWLYLYSDSPPILAPPKEWQRLRCEDEKVWYGTRLVVVPVCVRCRAVRHTGCHNNNNNAT